ncbi:MAG: HD domain-containing protein [Candidatus Riflebacteria bacterium]|nr:HD domain-containing protein [Candidatus Riflebacteria bacterium]
MQPDTRPRPSVTGADPRDASSPPASPAAPAALSPAACAARLQPRTEDLRGPYLRDQTAIIHSLPFRRLKHKTQVFFAPENDHLCTRIEHVMHVATIAVTIVRGLNRRGWQLDEEMAFAIGLGHDLGHAPFGHTGEFILHDLLAPFGGTFLHEVNGLRVVDCLANEGKGLNLTFAVRDGIACHNGEKFEPSLRPADRPNDLAAIRDRNCVPSTWEGCIMRFADKIAYLGRDLEDALEVGLITEDEIPPAVRAALGSRNGEIINALVLDLIESSPAADRIGFSEARFAVINELKRFNYQRIYFHPQLRQYEGYCRRILTELFGHLLGLLTTLDRDFPAWEAREIPMERAFGKHLRKLGDLYRREQAPAHRIVADYLSGMTDLFALSCIRQLIIPPPMPVPGRGSSQGGGV